jgi:transcriptional regulator with PAS, ATPase and Fis domain
MGRTKALVRKVISANVTVLLSGESGTGKEVLARAIHAESQRSRNPFLAINCGAIPENLIESELFGHARGAFTGASKSRAGLFEQAEGGSLFLDEIGELRLDLQVKLLRVLQDRCVRRLGCEKERSLDVRVIAATNLQLQDEVAAGRFRNDLYYRLSIFPVELPSLRERSVDILELAHYFLKKHGVRLGARASGFTPAAERALLSYHWPGNVRELENAIERAMLLAETDLVDLPNLPGRLGGQTPGAWPTGYGDPPDTLFSSGESSQIATLAAEERRILTRALEITGGNVKEAAKRLEIGRATLYRKIRAYGLALPKKSQAQ